MEQAFQYYPTPAALAQKAWSLFQNRDFVRVLEPSAGEGDLILGRRGEDDWRRDYIKFDVCEIDMSRHPILREHGFEVVGQDFLKMTDCSLYSHIILNPPFAQGAAHVLHAWNRMFDGEIVAIINAETIKNAFSAERQLLVKLIEDYGSVEYVQEAFVEAERTTNVEVALVYLRKKASCENLFGNLIAELKQEADAKIDFRPMNEVAMVNNDIENQVIAFNAATRALKEAVMAEARAGYYAALLGDTMAERNGEKTEEAARGSSVSTIQTEFGKRYRKLKDRAWASILRSSKITSRLSTKAQARLEADFENIKALEFTTENIYGFICGIVASSGQIQIGMMLDVFDEITRYHSENRVFYRGWVTNNAHRTCGFKLKAKRFILPGFSESWKGRGFPYEGYRKIGDLDKVFALLDGKHEPELSLESVFHTKMTPGTKVSSSYFTARWFAGIGTVHFYPTRPDLIDRLNRLVGRERKWLPEQEENNDFWTAYHRAEEFDEEITSEINAQARSRHISRWNHPVTQMERAGDEAQSSLDLVNAAIESVLEKHGIEPFAAIRGSHPVQQLELLAA